MKLRDTFLLDLLRFTIATSLMLFMIFSLVTNCKQFMASDLKPNLISQLEIGSSLNTIQAIEVNNNYSNLPMNIPVVSNRLFITDHNNSLIKVFNVQNRLEYMIGNPKNIDSTFKEKILPYNFSSLGKVYVSEDEKVYIQNIVRHQSSVTQKEEDLYTKRSGELKIPEDEISPSYIISINKQGKQEDVIGLKGESSEPFRLIEDFYPYPEDKVFVLHRYATQMVLSYYHKNQLVGSLYENSLQILDEKEIVKYKIYIDSMMPERTGKYALLSVAYFSNDVEKRFKFRRIFMFEYNTEKPKKLILEIKKPLAILFAILQNNHFYIWETESGTAVKLLLHDIDGNHIDNRRLIFSEPRKNWRETFINSNDALYSLKLNEKYLELYLWK